MKFDRKKLIEAIKQERHALSFEDYQGLRKLAKRAKIGHSSMNRILHGALPDLDTFAKICTWLNKPANDFFKK